MYTYFTPSQSCLVSSLTVITQCISISYHRTDHIGRQQSHSKALLWTHPAASQPHIMSHSEPYTQANDKLTYWALHSRQWRRYLSISYLVAKSDPKTAVTTYSLPVHHLRSLPVTPHLVLECSIVTQNICVSWIHIQRPLKQSLSSISVSLAVFHVSIIVQSWEVIRVELKRTFVKVTRFLGKIHSLMQPLFQKQERAGKVSPDRVYAWIHSCNSHELGVLMRRDCV